MLECKDCPLCRDDLFARDGNHDGGDCVAYDPARPFIRCACPKAL